MQGRVSSIYIHLNLVIHAGTCQRQYLVAVLALILCHDVFFVFYLFALTVVAYDAHLHLCALIPHGIILISIFPCYAYGVGTLVFPLG